MTKPTLATKLAESLKLQPGKILPMIPQGLGDLSNVCIIAAGLLAQHCPPEEVPEEALEIFRSLRDHLEKEIHPKRLTLASEGKEEGPPASADAPQEEKGIA